jgi:hypothetical protein
MQFAWLCERLFVRVGVRVGASGSLFRHLRADLDIY